MEGVSDNDSEDPVMLSYATICATTRLILKDNKMPYIVKKEAQEIKSALEGKISVNVPRLHEVPNLTIQTSAVSVFNQVSLATIAEA